MKQNRSRVFTRASIIAQERTGKTSERTRIVGWFRANRECEISGTVKEGSFQLFRKRKDEGQVGEQKFYTVRCLLDLDDLVISKIHSIRVRGLWRGIKDFLFSSTTTSFHAYFLVQRFNVRWLLFACLASVSFDPVAEPRPSVWFNQWTCLKKIRLHLKGDLQIT